MARGTTLASQADKYVCYERAVQTPEVDVAFIRRTFKRYRGRGPQSLREDFCGTAALCAEWARRVPGGTAVGIDLDEEPLNWGISHHILKLGRKAAGVSLIRGDAREERGPLSDVAVAFNFSYFVFKKRRMLLEYLKHVRSRLARDGILYLDLFGGPEAMELREERTEYETFTYVWDQAAFNPITHEILCKIHFEFPDGSRMRNAFVYDWRLWQIPELEDLAMDAGFRDFIVYWEGTDRLTGEGNGVFRPSRKGDNAPAFIVYMLCLK